ncbi:hypothetical protein P3T37_003113 [Kitasatospora sp. MAA4]|uniref:hypothetical protein n=1 Tax=Kitasatospora sp. MAA4 TaxID=3035093 RepID=UPI0024733451|nr:hypothetical protein [Kitasatospora sp. MAA4]MDH6133715.1 hypothetical protein [Kitasatospora sp. MAA4]
MRLNRSRVRLRFWGVAVDVLLQSEADEAHFGYYFQDYRRPADISRAEFEIALVSEHRSFVDSPPGALRRIHLKGDGNSWSRYDEYRDKPNRPTPLPPFALPPLNASVRTVHASAAAAPWSPGESVLLHGPSRAGKSVLLLELLRNGWSFVCDDTVPVEDERWLLSYSRPIGVRERTLDVHPRVRDHLAGAPGFGTPTGTTWAVHPALLPVRRAAERTAWAWTVTLAPSSDYRLTRLADRHWAVAFDPARHTRQAAAELSAALTGK